jgi:hypothetical protein
LEKNYRTQPRFDQTSYQGGRNAYFDKYDTAYDSRNSVRELQAVVYEDKDTEGIQSRKTFLGRSVDNHYLNTDQLKAIVETAASMRPLKDDFQKDYRS